MMMTMNCGMVDQWKAFSLISSREPLSEILTISQDWNLVQYRV